MNKPMPNWMFRFMIFAFWIRDSLISRGKVLAELDLQPGLKILDYGCGTGIYSLLAAQQVGPAGKVFALDIQPLAVKRVETESQKLGLKNIQTITSDCETGLPDQTIDVALLYDIFHMFKNPQKILAELHRVLKTEGILSFSDHHMNQKKILACVIADGWFKLLKKNQFTYHFVKS